MRQEKLNVKLVIPHTSTRRRDTGLLDERAPQILRCAQDDRGFCHPERSEGSLADLCIITSIKDYATNLIYGRIAPESG